MSNDVYTEAEENNFTWEDFKKALEDILNDIKLHVNGVEISCLSLNLVLKESTPAFSSYDSFSWDFLNVADEEILLSRSTSLMDSINSSTSISQQEKKRLCRSDEYEKYTSVITYLGRLFAVLSVDGLLLLDDNADVSGCDNLDRFIAYRDICEIRENEDGLTIIYGNSQERRFVMRTEENSFVLSCISGFLCSVTESYGIPRTQTVQSILVDDLNSIINNPYGHAYLCGRNAKQSYSKKLKGALKTYASKVNQKDVVGFIDDSVFGSGKSGILFGKEGIAFAAPLTREYLLYHEIDNMEVSEKGDNITFSGSFSTRRKKFLTPSFFGGTSYNLDVLKKCIEEIKRTAVS